MKNKTVIVNQIGEYKEIKIVVLGEFILEI